MNILVALSGGVDSAVVAALMKSQGHRVIGVTMSIWREGRYQGGDKDACFGAGEKEDIAAAGEVCRLLGLQHMVIDCAEEYERLVLEHFRSQYLVGKTPNPCVRCNNLIKFGLLPQLAEKAGLDFDIFATGHYVRLEHGSDRVRMFSGREAAKDQSYFLYRLRQKQLARVWTPLGGYSKPEVRKIAGDFSLPVRDKPDSQDFYAGDYRELLGREARSGSIVHVSGRALGRHEGYWNFTVGQRAGLGISYSAPLYVKQINADRNEVVVGGAETAIVRRLTAEDANWVSIPEPQEAFAAMLKVRSSGRAVPCRARPKGDGAFEVDFPEGIFAAAPGQSAVLYHDDMLLGGGIISAAN
ncbi:MAG: tRNA 2-thiouridine(34) synthase MnmA [Candidatus Adiutrix sp.]|jgi:tRNA-specific 2-thiouridylase|nr:tRNA 2-thiouridine(34) synthase MnmA [Candidatus Adiutrix sp.]